MSKSFWIFSLMMIASAAVVVRSQSGLNVQELHTNCVDGNVEYVKSAIDQYGRCAVVYEVGAVPDNANVLSCMQWAAYYGQDDLVTYLFNSGVSVDQKLDTGRSSGLAPLILTVAPCDKLSTTDLLLSYGANPNINEDSPIGSWTALQTAAVDASCRNTLINLWQKGARVDVQNPAASSLTALRLAIRHRVVENIKELIRLGASVEAASSGDWSNAEFEASMNDATVQSAIQAGIQLRDGFQDQENLCETGFCQNGGTCVRVYAFFLCICPEEWLGAICDQAKIHPRSSDCSNHGTWNVRDCPTRGEESVTCDCEDGWGGEYCELAVSGGTALMSAVWRSREVTKHLIWTLLFLPLWA
jgi:hypothetical protein